MKNFLSKFKWFVLGAGFSWILLPLIVYAINVTVPQATQVGQIPTGLSSGNYAAGNLIAGSNITITTSTPGQITFSATGGSSVSTSSVQTILLPLIANGTVAGVNATSSTVSFNVQGSGNLNPFNVSSSSGTSLLQVAANGSTTISSLSVAGNVQSTAAGSLYVNGQTGTGLNVLQTSPTLVTPILGTASGTALSLSGSFFTNIQSGTQCVHALANGLLAGTGSDCGSGGSGSISTSTTAQIGKVAIWTGLATLGNGALFDNGAVAGVNATSSTITFNIQGSAGSTNTLFNVASSSGTSVLSVSSLGNVVFQSSATGTPFLINSSGGSPIMIVDTTQTIPHYNFNAGTSTLVSSLYVQGTIASTTLPIFGVASSSGTSYLSVASSGWLIKGGDGAGTVSTCGTGTGTVTGNDQGGVITTATAATACTYTFKTPAPAGTTVVCNVTDNSLVGFADISSVSSSAVTFGISSALTGGLLYYTCGAYK